MSVSAALAGVGCGVAPDTAPNPGRLIDRRRHRLIAVDTGALLAARRAADTQAFIDHYRKEKP